ncbi:MAG: hypothetical protein V1720_01795 [bacterium]
MQKLLSFNKYLVIIVSITLLSLFFAGCGKKSEEEQKPAAQTEKQQAAEQPPETAGDNAAVDEKEEAEETAPSVPNLLGEWTGTLDGRATTFTITEQDGLKFKGKIIINFRNPVNQQVEGFFRTETGELFMDDVIHTKYMGKYRALFEGGFERLSGTFTQTSDKKNATFTLIKNK